MRLKTQKIAFTDSNDNEIDIEDVAVEVHRNGEATGLLLDDLMHGYREYDEGEIYGQTLLSYFEPKPDGKLYYENSYVELVTPTGALKVTRIARPSMQDDTSIDFDTLNKFVQQFGITHPDKMFDDLLTDAQKQAFVQARENTQKKTDAKKQAEAQRQAEQADKVLRAKVKPENMRDAKELAEMRKYYKEKKCTEYTSGPYLVFHGNPDEEPCLYIQRGKDWGEEPDQIALEHAENSKIIVFEFDDLGTQKELEFNPESGEIKLVE